jgi:hypothetical protein
MTNPLIEKYFELYPEKKEKPKLPRIEDYKGEKTIADEVKEEKDIFSKYMENLNFPYAPPQSVATSNTGITAANPFPITKLTSYDNESLNDSFLQIAEKVKNKQAQIYSMNMDIDQQTRTQRITFEVWDTF